MRFSVLILAVILTAITGASYGQVGIPFPGPGGISTGAIGTPEAIGDTENTSSNTSSCAITTTADIKGGDLVVVGVEIPSALLVTATGGTDGTNSYSVAVEVDDGANYYAALLYTANAAAVSSGSTITVTFSGATTGSNGYGCQAIRVVGIPSSPLDKTASQSATTASPSA